MPFINRASLGAEFYDITSATMLLQPEPQYLYAQLWKMALNASLSQQPAGIGFRANAGTHGLPYPAAEDSRLIFEDPIYNAAFVNVAELGNGPGHTVRLNRPAFANTTYTAASREIPSGSTISTTPINVASEQVSITLKRFGGPYDQVNGNVAPFGVDRFDASLPVHKIAAIVGMQMQRDFDKTIDGFVGTLLGLGANTLWPNGYTVDTQFSNANGDGPMSYSMINQTERKLDDLNIPVFADGYRTMVMPPLAIQQLKDDPQFARYSELHPPINPVLAKTYYRTVGRMHIFKSTSLPTTTNGSSGTVQISHAFGPGVLGSGVGEMPHTVASTADNYGESALVIWLMYGGFQVMDNRFCVVVHTN